MLNQEMNVNKFIRLLAVTALAIPPAFADKPELVSGQVVKVDAGRGKVTLKHGPIKSIDMAAMTMPFKVSDASMLQAVKPCDRVRFSVAMVQDELVITQLDVANSNKAKP